MRDNKSMPNVYHTKKVSVAAALVIVDTLFFGLFNPQTSSTFIVILGCCLLVITIYLVSVAFTELLSWGIPLTKITRRRFALFVTMLSAFLILMQSIGQLTLRDALAVLPLVLIAYLYITYNRAKQAG